MNQHLKIVHDSLEADMAVERAFAFHLNAVEGNVVLTLFLDELYTEMFENHGSHRTHFERSIEFRIVPDLNHCPDIMTRPEQALFISTGGSGPTHHRPSKPAAIQSDLQIDLDREFILHRLLHAKQSMQQVRAVRVIPVVTEITASHPSCIEKGDDTVAVVTKAEVLTLARRGVRQTGHHGFGFNRSELVTGRQMEGTAEAMFEHGWCLRAGRTFFVLFGLALALFLPVLIIPPWGKTA
ncbi:hypothetical protein [Marinobacter sp. JSM 1782161]|uniref:hypothetical protein n=1 Tax=Marinobacter sp. JSM 1782161 TaxID=2685906 RepID=UPI001402A829|nr:hypothetical protein [Marinobacter sp. JSM 1782161]